MDEGRKEFLQRLGLLSAGVFLAPGLTGCAGKGSEETKRTNENEAKAKKAELFFDISLAQWSLHRSFFGEETMGRGWEYMGQTLHGDNPEAVLQGTLKPIEFPSIAKKQFGISAVEYVNTFYFDKAEDQAFLRDLKSRADDAGVKSVLIMCDAEGDLGTTDEEERIKAVENHYKWVEAASFLGCHSIRVNAAGQGTKEEVAEAATDGLSRLCKNAKEHDINVIVENHGGYSSNGQWLSGVIKNVDASNCGTLPDFGNFQISEGNMYDRYKGVKELMPYAKGVSAKSHVFDENGNETETDFSRMLKIVKDAGFEGYVGIEYEGDGLSEEEGIKATKKLLEKTGKELTK